MFDDIFNAFIKNMDNSTDDIVRNFDDYFNDAIKQSGWSPTTNDEITEMMDAKRRIKLEYETKLGDEIRTNEHNRRESEKKKHRADADTYENGTRKKTVRTLDDGTIVEDFYNPDGELIVQKQIKPDGTRDVFTVRSEQEMNDLGFSDRDKANHRRKKRTTTSADGKTIEMSNQPDSMSSSYRKVDLETGEYSGYNNAKRARPWQGSSVPEDQWYKGNLYNENAQRRSANTNANTSTDIPENNLPDVPDNLPDTINPQNNLPDVPETLPSTYVNPDGNKKNGFNTDDVIEANYRVLEDPIEMSGPTADGKGNVPRLNAPASEAADEATKSLLDQFMDMSFVEKIMTVGNIAFAVSDYKTARREGHGVISSAMRAGTQFAIAEAMGMYYPIFALAKELPGMTIKGAELLYKENRKMNSAANNQIFGGAQFQDTQQLATMRQSGMEMAKMAQYNLQQSLMGQEATYLHR